MASTVTDLESNQSLQAPRPATGQRLAGVLVTLPDRLMTFLLAVSVVVAVALLFGQFRPWLVVPIAVLAIIATARLVPPAPRVNPIAVAGSGAALLIAIAWYLVHRAHTAEMIGLDRDPAQYTLSALFLVHHTAPDVPLDPALPALAAKVPGVLTDFLKGGSGAVNHIQGNDLLPGLLAVFGWLHGAAGVFTGNVVLGALALLSVYALARRILGPLWGLAPMLLLGATMPLAAFSRMPYTEPLALVFTCGMLVALWVAVDRRSTLLFALAGAFGGATMMARIDGGLTMVAGLSAVSLLALAPASAARRREGRMAVLVFLAGALPAAALGWLDLFVHSRKYLSGLSGELYPVLAVVPVIAVLAICGSLLRRFRLPATRLLAGSASSGSTGPSRGPAARPDGASGLDSTNRRRRPTNRRLATVVGVAVGIGCLLMVTRPWWLIDHFVRNRDDSDYVGAVAARQLSEKLPVDGTRSYDEMTISWLAWYLSWPVVGAALIGAVLSAVQFCRKRDPRLLVVWVVPVVVGLVYLNRISITPDQIWALRRLLPVVIPATAISAAYAFRTVTMTGFPMLIRGSLGAALPRAGAFAVLLARAIGIVATIVVVLHPATFWGKMFDSREGIGEYALINQVCAKAGNGLIVQAGPYPIMGSALPALQELCSDKAVSIHEPTQTSMASIKAAWTGAGPVTVIAFFPDAVTWTSPIDPSKPLAKVIFSRWESVLSRRPANLNLQQVSAWIGTLQPSGAVTPLNTRPFAALLPDS